MNEHGIVDSARQGGAGTTTAAVRDLSAPLVTVDEALARVADMEWRRVRTRSHRIMTALAEEVLRLRAELAAYRHPGAVTVTPNEPEYDDGA